VLARVRVQELGPVPLRVAQRVLHPSSRLRLLTVLVRVPGAADPQWVAQRVCCELRVLLSAFRRFVLLFFFWFSHLAGVYDNCPAVVTAASSDKGAGSSAAASSGAEEEEEAAAPKFVPFSGAGHSLVDTPTSGAGAESGAGMTEVQKAMMAARKRRRTPSQGSVVSTGARVRAQVLSSCSVTVGSRLPSLMHGPSSRGCLPSLVHGPCCVCCVCGWAVTYVSQPSSAHRRRSMNRFEAQRQRLAFSGSGHTLS